MAGFKSVDRNFDAEKSVSQPVRCEGEVSDAIRFIACKTFTRYAPCYANTLKSKPFDSM
jgi:hypothetical protein